MTMTVYQPTSHIFTPYLLTFLLSYHFLHPYFNTPRQKAWIVTTISSCFMTIFSLPFFLDYLSTGGSLIHVRRGAALAYNANRLFQAYLFADLILGTIYYHEQVGLLTGWVHHSAYIVVVECVIRRDWSHMFCLCALMELPTFILSLGSLRKSLRSDSLFATTFFSTRICFHIVLFYSFLLGTNREALFGGSYVPAFILAAAFPMHAMWFMGCIKGMIKRHKQQKNADEPTSQASDVRTEASATGTSSSSSSSSKATRVPDSSSRTETARTKGSTPSTSPFTVSSPASTSTSEDIDSEIPTPPTRPLHSRRQSFERALRTLRSVEAAKLELSGAIEKIQQSEKFKEFRRARENVYARLPGRREVFDYIGLAPSRGSEVVAY